MLEDFTKLSVVPKFDDIISNQTSQLIRKNIINGSFQNVNDYLDIQFRLMREDFIQPLRDGVQKIRQLTREASANNQLYISRNGKQLTDEIKYMLNSIESISAYFDCLIQDSVPCHLGMVYEVKFANEQAESIKWEHSKKLLFGSLVCFL